MLGAVDPDTNHTVVPSSHTLSGSTMISMEPAPHLTNLTSIHFHPQMHGIGEHQSQFSPTNTPPGSQLTHAQGITDIHGTEGALTPDSLQLNSTPHSQENVEFTSQDTKRKRK